MKLQRSANKTELLYLLIASKSPFLPLCASVLSNLLIFVRNFSFCIKVDVKVANMVTCIVVDVDADVKGKRAQACSFFARLFNSPKLNENIRARLMIRGRCWKRPRVKCGIRKICDGYFTE